MMFLLFQDFSGFGGLIQTVGFPIALSLGLLFFAYKAWLNLSSQVKAKDDVIVAQIEKHANFRSELIHTQQTMINTQKAMNDSQVRIAGSQEKIFDSVDALTDVMKDIKSVLQTKGR